MEDSVITGDDLTGYVLISVHEYEDLIGDACFLMDLHEAGIEHWENYSSVVNGETITGLTEVK